MRSRYNKFNLKRRLLSEGAVGARLQEFEQLAKRARYGGNPEHKRHPGDFGLTPPSGPRPGKSLCDAAKIFSRSEAQALLREGLKRGLVSDRHEGEWPKNIWSVTAEGFPLEAQLENPESGTYHGYPMPESDPMHAEIVKRWGNHGVYLKFQLTWMSSESDDPYVRATAVSLGMFLDDTSLTLNEDIWAQTVRDKVFVSAYPLAQWFANSWWRLNHEPLPTLGKQPTHDWRMAHELGAANHGFVWPSVVMASDGESMLVWAAPQMTHDQSVRYLQGLAEPRLVALERFQLSVSKFIQATLSRLDAKELAGSELAHLWALIQEDLVDTEAHRRRKLEAQLGFDPEDCPMDILEAALQWRERVGDVALSELAPAIAQSGGNPDLAALGRLEQMPGLAVAPEVHFEDIHHLKVGLPWQRASHAASSLRSYIANDGDPISDHQLNSLLGLTGDQMAKTSSHNVREPVTVAVPTSNGAMRIVPRKRNPRGRRFELARILGEHLRSGRESHWLASTDLPTSRQKYQRAFAAEFLCPFSSLEDYLGGDYSLPAIEDAADHFDVGEQTVQAQLANHGLIATSQFAANMPYRMVA